MLPAQPNQSLIDGLACLQALAAADGPAGSIDLARLLDMEPTRANRLLKTLAALGFARQNSQRKYIAGPAMHVLAAQSMKGSRLLACAMPVIGELQAEGLTVALGVLWRAHVCYLFHGKPRRQLVEGVFHYELFPALKSSIGLALLARKTNREITELLKSAPPGVPRALDAETRALLAAARGNGFCHVRRGRDDTSIGVVIGDPAVAGLAFAGPFSDQDAPRLARVLQEAAAQIEGSLNEKP
ncbi:MAG TPA: helix-turn-helix domain-containing protein [Chthoniobacterales bacterium]